MASKSPRAVGVKPAVKPPFAQPAETAVLPVVTPIPEVPAALAATPASLAPVPAPAATPAPEAATPTSPAPEAAAETATPEPTAAVTTAAPSKKEEIMEAINEATDKGQAQAQAMFTEVNDRAKSAMEKGSKMIEEMGAFSKGNLEALAESTKIATKGAEDVARYTGDYARTSVEKANAAAKQFASVKSPTELFKLQGDLAKEAMDTMMAETAKFTENYLKLLGEIAQPLSNRVAVAAEKMKIAA